jgi:UPF0755 protein
VLAVLVVLALITVAAAGAAAFWVNAKIDPAGAPGEVVAITIPEGSSTADVATLLADAGVVSDARVFQWYLRFNGEPTLQAGDYELRTNEAMGEVSNVLEAGPAPVVVDQTTVPEGLSVFATPGLPAPGPVVNTVVEDIPRLDATRFLEVLLSGEVTSRFQPAGVPPNLEGLLFPDTYQFDPEEAEAEVVATMVEQMDTVATELGIDQAPTTVGLTPYEVLIVASLIERETLVPEERAMVARVIYNRLEANNPLGIDASTQYALGRAPETTSDFDPASPYNLRANQGLPPTPIGVPGRASIEAALNPAEGDWFYYVLQSQDGSHLFTASEAEFLAAKEQCQEMGLC